MQGTAAVMRVACYVRRLQRIKNDERVIFLSHLIGDLAVVLEGKKFSEFVKKTY